MSTPTHLVNRALRYIGKATIADLLTSNGKEASVARQVYDDVRREVLGLGNWWFAERRVQLTASGTTPTTGYDYAYILPDDFIRLVSVHPDDSDESTVPYRLGNQSGDDRVIFTDAVQLYIRYIFDLQDVTVMPPSFQTALAFRLAQSFASAMSASGTTKELTDREWKRVLRQARAIEGAEDYPKRLAEGSWTSGREDEDEFWSSW